MSDSEKHEAEPRVADRIEKQVVLRASRARAWRAISNSSEFGTWFGVAFDGQFLAGTAIRGKIVPTKVDPEVAKLQQPYDGRAFNIAIEKLDPEREFSFRWHPFAIDVDVDYAGQPTTLVVFVLNEVSEGVLLTITESGFEQVPLERRAKAFAANEGGWTHQAKLLEKYLTETA
jgi:uncharacterized protein YndB with AHSA1/START domain